VGCDELGKEEGCDELGEEEGCEGCEELGCDELGCDDDGDEEVGIDVGFKLSRLISVSAYAYL